MSQKIRVEQLKPAIIDNYIIITSGTTTTWAPLSFPIFTGNTSGDCITDIWTTNLNSCTNLHIQPGNAGNVYISENGGSVGVGTTSPIGKFHVDGSIGTTILGSISDNIGGWFHVATVGGGNGFIFLEAGGSTNNPLDHRIHVTGGNGGNFGMYDLTGVARLTMGAGIGVSRIYTDNDSATGAFEVTANGDVITSQTLGVGVPASTARLHVQGQGSTSATYGLDIQNSSAVSTFRVRDDNVVEINGGTGYGAALEVYQNSSSNTPFSFWNTGFGIQLFQAYDTGVSGWIRLANGAVNIDQYVGRTEFGPVSGGFGSVVRVGADIAGSQDTFAVGSIVPGASAHYMGFDTDDSAVFYIQDKTPSTRIRLAATGDTFFNVEKVGVGTSTPSATLDVVGTLQYTDGNQATGYVLTSDASGNATWQIPTGTGNTIFYVTTQFTGNTSASCITDIYVSNVNSCSPLNISPNGNPVNVGPLIGVNDRMVEANSGGTITATKVIITTYGIPNTEKLKLENVSNWTINGSYTGSTITNTYQGQKHYDNNYLFEAVADNDFIRLVRG